MHTDGSGCSRRFAAEVAAWQKARAAERRLVAQIADHAILTWGWDLFNYIDSRGDVREPLVVRWMFSAPLGEVVERLRPLFEFPSDEDAIEVENGPDGAPHVLMTLFEGLGSDHWADWHTVGFLHLDEGRLVADVPTRAWANRVIAEVAGRLGAAATLVETRSSLPVCVHARECVLPVPTEWLDRSNE